MSHVTITELVDDRLEFKGYLAYGPLLIFDHLGLLFDTFNVEMINKRSLLARDEVAQTTTARVYLALSHKRVENTR
ncbi:hypothetical protein G6F57_023555 [Rhizopus arrhizus]|nr:hypothetical protein G6F57_023555 [Rhizopus arrhizus]